MSSLDPALIDAYRRTRYHVQHFRGPFTFQIDEPAPRLSAILRQHGADGSVFVTAWNPRGEPQDRAVNDARQRRLLRELDALGYVVFEGFGAWPEAPERGEESVLVLGISLDEGRELGRRYEQNAIVWAAADGVPQLVLLR